MKEPNVCRFFGSLSVAYAAPVWTSDEIENLLLKKRSVLQSNSKVGSKRRQITQSRVFTENGMYSDSPCCRAGFSEIVSDTLALVKQERRRYLPALLESVSNRD